MTSEDVIVIRRARAVLLDFDGPVCDAFAGYPASEVAQDMLASSSEAGVPISEEAATMTDPMEVLRYLFKVAPERQAESDRMLRDAEIFSVEKTSPTPGTIDFMEACRETGRSVMVVSNNSPEAVKVFFERRNITNYIYGIVGRNPSSPNLMKPNPYLLNLAIKKLDKTFSECLMIGDSVTDIEVAKAVNVPVVGYANKPGKAEIFRSLGSDFVTQNMGELASLVRVENSYQ
ncbi:HAD family hydrolase [Nocardiopsis ansamitocini]|uniref:Hydrolase n=1 Tax=Nocardiopsis ansamitocini TaxID=1670832 RepID=A0A9W6P920_9ACTN|nr:HAD-IA family hydrolase [Nocardiopsis ansamitocini]GLU49840.1 hydrolase [Nocardiopsis ansamitocini]